MASPNCYTAAAPATHAAETRRAYASDWQAFTAWCRAAAHPALPASPATVAAFLTGRPDADARSRGATGRSVAAIAARHRQDSLPDPTQNATVRAVLRAIRRRTTPGRRAAAPTASCLQLMAVHCGRDLAGLRDRAILLLAAAGLGRAAVVGLDAEAVQFTEHGLALPGMRPGRGVYTVSQDPQRPGTLIVCRCPDHSLCPVRAVEAWLAATGTRYGPVFRKIDRWGTVEDARLGTDAVRRILLRRALNPRLPAVPAMRVF